MRRVPWPVGIVALILSGCLSAPFPRPAAIDPDVARADIARLIPPRVNNAPGWAIEIFESRASRFAIPAFVVNAAMDVKSPDGRTYNRRLAAVRTEKDLSVLYEDFIGSVPLAKLLFDDWNPVRTAGPMQVNIAFAEKQLKARRYPYALPALGFMVANECKDRARGRCIDTKIEPNPSWRT